MRSFTLALLLLFLTLTILQTVSAIHNNSGNKVTAICPILSTTQIHQNILNRSLKIRIYLEGALMNAGNIFSGDGRRLMRDNLRVSPYNGKNYIPLTDPYQTTVKLVDLSITNKHAGIGGSPALCTITDSLAVFSVTGQNAIVDWVFVEIRSGNDHKEVIATRSGLLQRDGDIVDVDGVSDLNFPDLIEESFYVVVRHRNHLGVMSLLTTGEGLIDFTSLLAPVFDFGTTYNPAFNFTGLAQNKYVYNVSSLWTGDASSDLLIRNTGTNDDQNIIFMETSTYLLPGSPFNAGVIGYFQGDINMDSKVKFDNPFDDKNTLFAQILFYNLNTSLLGNFSLFFEQVPLRN